LARTGSKSTNHDLKSVRAMASSVSFIRRLSSILSSSVPRIWAMARCSGRGGVSRGMRFMFPCVSFGIVEPERNPLMSAAAREYMRKRVSALSFPRTIWAWLFTQNFPRAMKATGVARVRRFSPSSAMRRYSPSNRNPST
jgi:hypothetical protein